VFDSHPAYQGHKMENSEIKKELDETAREFDKYVQALEQEQETYWNSLTEDQRLMAFCSVVRRIYKGEVEKRGTYRYVLYDVFDFGPQSYMLAQLAGYLSIHNLIYEGLEAEEQQIQLSKEQM
jgi:hypothetical protein